jgi:cytochrome P450
LNCLLDCHAIRVAPNELHITDPTLYKTIYSQTGEFFKDPTFYVAFGISHTVFGETNPAKHKVRRRMLNSYFSHNAIAAIQPVILESLAEVSQRLAKRNSNIPLNIHGLSRSLTTDVISKYSFGSSLDIVKTCDEDFTPTSSIITAFDATGPFIYPRAYQPTVRWLSDLIPIFIAIRLSPAVKSVQAFIHECGKTCRAYKESNIKASNPLIFEGLENLSEREMAEESANILAAGSDTTAYTLTFACQQLCQNPEMMKRLAMEVDVAYRATPGQQPALKDLESIPYLGAVVKEAVRLATAVPARLPRVVPSTLKTPLIVDNKVVPVGTVVGMSAYAMHRNKELWGMDASTFNPDRWLRDDSKGLMNNMVSFSKGLRSCIGQNLALAELHIVLAYLAHEYDMSVATHATTMEKYDGFTTHLKSPVLVNLRSRHNR